MGVVWLKIRKHDIPTEITEEQYNDIKANKEQYPKELVGFTGIAVTFGSTWFGTYARNKRGTNYAMEGRKNLMKQVERLQGTIFTSSSYCDIALPENSIIYCDPPYEGVAGYKDKLNYIAFWQWCREKSKEGHSVFISEYNAPNDFECLWQSELKTNMNAKYETKPVEKLFKSSATISGSWPIKDAAITTAEPIKYFQNLFSSVTACCINI